MSRALVLVHPEPQSDVERDLVRLRRMTIEQTENAPLFKRIGSFLKKHKKDYDYIVYLPSEEIGDSPWESLCIPPAIQKHEDDMDLIDANSLEEQALLLEQVLRAKKIKEVHVAGLARECCVADISDYLAGNAHGLDGIGIIDKPFQVYVLERLTDATR